MQRFLLEGLGSRVFGTSVPAGWESRVSTSALLTALTVMSAVTTVTMRPCKVLRDLSQEKAFHLW